MPAKPSQLTRSRGRNADVGEIMVFSDDNVKALLAGQVIFLSNAHKFLQTTANDWTRDNAHQFFASALKKTLEADPSSTDGDYVRLWNLYQRFHLYMDRTWEVELGIQKKRTDFYPETVNASVLSAYYDAFLDKIQDASLSEAKAKQLFPSDEVKAAQDFHTSVVARGDGPFARVDAYFTEERRATSPKAFQKFLVQHLICRMLYDTLTDYRNIAYQKAKDAGKEDKIPKHFEQNEADWVDGESKVEVKEVKATIKKRTREIKAWLNHFETLPYKE